MRLIVVFPDPLEQCPADTSGAAQHEMSCFGAGGGNVDSQAIVGKACGDSFGPFDQAQPVAAGCEFIGPDRHEFVRITEAIRIKMSDWEPSVRIQLQEHKSRAIDLGDIDSQPCADGSR